MLCRLEEGEHIDTLEYCKERCRPRIQVDSRVPIFNRAPALIYYMRGCVRLCYSIVHMSISHCDYSAAST
jgi:hypothetical protein